MLIRLPPMLAEELRQLARVTRIRQSDYLREAVADLLAKYRAVAGTPAQSWSGGSAPQRASVTACEVTGGT
jgi:hypothetical protein